MRQEKPRLVGQNEFFRQHLMAIIGPQSLGFID
jgi:hypothetical protein